MIIVNLMGGLGNQMFQYATAKSLAIRNGCALEIDASRFHKLTANREHTLQVTSFAIAAPPATPGEIRGLIRPMGLFPRLATLLGASPFKYDSPALFREPAGSQFKPEVLAIPDNRYLIGYFNSYKYFAQIRDVLIDEFKPKEALSAAGQKLSAMIDSSNAVSIHLRRGDYVEDPAVCQCVAGIITDRFYRNAIERVCAYVANPHFYVFSNDMPWVRENFKIPHAVTYVDANPPQRGFEDLWLMSRCRHNILAGGSTFSWWAAYLNPHPDKIVIRTENISTNPTYNHPADYFLPDWEVVTS